MSEGDAKPSKLESSCLLRYAIGFNLNVTFGVVDIFYFTFIHVPPLPFSVYLLIFLTFTILRRYVEIFFFHSYLVNYFFFHSLFVPHFLIFLPFLSFLFSSFIFIPPSSFHHSFILSFLLHSFFHSWLPLSTSSFFGLKHIDKCMLLNGLMMVLFTIWIFRTLIIQEFQFQDQNVDLISWIMRHSVDSLEFSQVVMSGSHCLIIFNNGTLHGLFLIPVTVISRFHYQFFGFND